MPTQNETGFDLADDLGCDLLWADDLDAAHRLESGVSLLAHDIWHRWTCPPGRNPDDPDYGIDVTDELLHRPLTPYHLAVLPRRLEAEARKDDRVGSISVALSRTAPGVYKITARGATSTAVPFRLVAEVSDALSRILEAA